MSTEKQKIKKPQLYATIFAIVFLVSVAVTPYWVIKKHWKIFGAAELLLLILSTYFFITYKSKGTINKEPR